MKIYGCYISGTYLSFFETEAEAQSWASAHGEEFAEGWLQGQYEALDVSVSTAASLLAEQPILGHAEALAYA